MGTRSKNLQEVSKVFNPLGVGNKIRGGALANQTSRDAALYTQMRIVPHGRRIVCSAGISGQQTCLVLDGSNTNSGVTQIYPTGLAERVMARQRVRLTPGYGLVARMVALPTGPVQHFVGSSWIEDGTRPAGHIRIDVTYDNGVTTTSVSGKMTPKVSALQYKGLPAGAGAAWGVVQHLSVAVDPPSEVGWGEHVIADITIVAVGGVRPLDVMVYETPREAFHDNTHREGTIPLSVEQIIPAVEYPLTGRNPTGDNRWGSQQANKTLQDQRQIWGPVLASWTCWNEDAVTVTATEGTATAFTATTYRELGYTATSYSTTAPGFSVSSGAYARNLEQSGPLELRGVNGVIPVTVRVWARMTNAAHSGTVRFQSATYSYRDLTITGSTSFAWYSGLWWMRVPPHASLDSHLQVHCKVTTLGHQLEVRYCSVEYGGHFEVVE